jgi:translocation and assembly module TamA
MVLAACWLGLAVAPGLAAEETGQAVPYKPILEGAPDDDIAVLLTSMAVTFTKQDQAPADKRMLQRRIDDDLSLFTKAMSSQGYFKAKVEALIQEDRKPIRVVFKLNPGPAFLLEKLAIQAIPESEGQSLPEMKELDLIKGARYRAEDILAAERKLLQKVGSQGFPFPAVKDRRITADHATNTVDVTFVVETGSLAVFGSVEFTGLDSLEAGYVRNQLPWNEGDVFDEALLARGQARLLRTGLFSLVRISKGELDLQGRLPILINVTERPFRTVRVGLGYQSDTGPEVRFGWEHRNLFGAGEKLTTSLIGNLVDKNISLAFRKPDFLREDQSLLAGFEIADEQTDAYHSLSSSVSSGLEWQFTNTMTAGLATRYRFVYLEEDGNGSDYYSLLSWPVYFNLDDTDNILNATRGGRLNVQMAPTTDLLNNSSDFVKYQVGYSRYLELVDDQWLVLAGRVLMGGMTGGDLYNLPKDEMFYAGGGGSVRGYAYQTAGEMTKDRYGEDEPVGGLSKVEMSAEVRFKVTKSTGLVAFLDGGRAFSKQTPDFREKLFWGTGLGVRYYTSIGPVRIDLGIPLEKRDGIDADYQIYLSLGQAF